MMPVDYQVEEMWHLSDDRRTVRMLLPGLPIVGVPEPLRVNIDFDAGVIEQMIDRLMVLRLQMLPKRAPARKQN